MSSVTAGAHPASGSISPPLPRTNLASSMMTAVWSAIEVDRGVNPDEVKFLAGFTQYLTLAERETVLGWLDDGIAVENPQHRTAGIVPLAYAKGVIAAAKIEPEPVAMPEGNPAALESFKSVATFSATVPSGFALRKSELEALVEQMNPVERTQAIHFIMTLPGLDAGSRQGFLNIVFHPAFPA